MRTFLIAAVLAAFTAPAMAGDEIFCDKPEYAMLKEASKRELDKGYCSARMNLGWNQTALDATRGLINQRLARGADAVNDTQLSEAYLKAGRSCRAASTAYEDALARRFKAKPTPTCTKF